MDGTSCSELDHLAVLDGQATSELLRLVLNSVPSGLLMVDGDGLITMANAAMFDLFRWSPSDLVGRPVEDLVPGSLQETHRQHRSDFSRAPSVRAMGEGRLLHGRRSDGSEFMVEVALSPISIGGAPQVLAVVRDITAHVDAEALARSQHAFQAVSQDRMRIARDLHDSVIQELFAAGLTIANAAASVEGPIADLLNRLIETLDTSIRHLRGAIFEFRAVEEAGDDIRKIVAEATRILGFEPELTIAGDPHHLEGSLQADVAAVVRESLSNVARHAAASHVSVTVDISADQVTIRVIDDGIGVVGSERTAGTGLRSLEERARRRGGEALIEPSTSGGNTVVWHTPLGEASTGGLVP